MILDSVEPKFVNPFDYTPLSNKYFCSIVEKTLMLGKIGGRRRRGQQRKRWLDSITDSVDVNLRKFWEIVEDKRAWCAAVHGDTKSQTQLND